MSSQVAREISTLIREQGRITFAQFMQVCLYSPRGGFYAARDQRIDSHFGTSSMSHPVFGVLIARQLEQMWHLLGDPAVFHVIEVASGDGSLAQSILAACQGMAPRFAEALCYVGVDYAPRWRHSAQPRIAWRSGPEEWMFSNPERVTPAPREVQAEGLHAFRRVVGCILSNELIDNMPVHRFAIQDGRVQEVFVTQVNGELREALDEPSTPRIRERLARLGLKLPEGYRGEINLGLDDWSRQIADTLDKGFVLTIDYGDLAAALYSARNHEGTLACHHEHCVTADPLQDLGAQDITSHVDFTSLIQAGEAHGLTEVGYAPQRDFLAKLGFESFLDALEQQGLSAARTTLSRMAMMSLVDPDQYGDLKVLAQAKGIAGDVNLEGFRRS